MSRTITAERALLGEADYAVVADSHHPTLATLDAAALAALEARLTELHDRTRDLVRQRRKEVRGKEIPRGAGPVPAEPNLAEKKQVFAAALKRIGREKARREGR